MDQRFPRTLRLLRPAEFRIVFDHGRSRSDDRLIVYARPRDGGGPTRLGLVVGRKFGPAHLRNAWKRIVREAFRTTRGELPPEHDLVVLPAVRRTVPTLDEVVVSLSRVAHDAASSFAQRGPRG